MNYVSWCCIFFPSFTTAQALRLLSLVLGILEFIELESSGNDGDYMFQIWWLHLKMLGLKESLSSPGLLAGLLCQ